MIGCLFGDHHRTGCKTLEQPVAHDAGLLWAFDDSARQMPASLRRLTTLLPSKGIGPR